MPRKNQSQSGKQTKAQGNRVSKRKKTSPINENNDVTTEDIIDISLKPSSVDRKIYTFKNSIFGERIEQNQQVSGTSESHEGVIMTSNLDQDKDLHSNVTMTYVSPNTTPDFIENTPPTINNSPRKYRKPLASSTEAAPLTSNNNMGLQSKHTASISPSVDEVKQAPSLASRSPNACNVATSESCKNSMLEFENIQETQQISLISESRECSEGVMTPSLDEDKELHSNIANNITSPNTAPDLIEGTPPAINLRVEAAPITSNNNKGLQSKNAASIISSSLDKVKQAPSPGSRSPNACTVATSESCKNSMLEFENIQETQQISLISESRECSEGVMTPSLDEDEKLHSNIAYNITSPNTALHLIEGTPPVKYLRAEAAPLTSNNNKVHESKNAASISPSLDEVKQAPSLASRSPNACNVATSESCKNCMPELDNIQENQQVSVISESRECSEGVMTQSLDEDKELHSNIANNIISPNTTPDFIKGTSPAMNLRVEAAPLTLNNNKVHESNESDVISPSVLLSGNIYDDMEASCSGIATSEGRKLVSLEEDLYLSDDSVADPDWATSKEKRRKVIRFEIDDTKSDETESDIETEPPKKKRTNKTTRWHKRNEDTYHKNRQKKLRSECLPYVNAKKQLKPAKAPRANACNCRLKCSENFTEETRTAICKAYWGLADYKRQKDFILMNVKPHAPVIRLVAAKRPRAVSRFYYLTNDQSKTRVCEKNFKATLCISNGPINKAFTEVGMLGSFEGNDGRGRHEPSNKTSADDEDYVKKHIESFPVMESHYCRKTSSKKYLESNLSIPKMYELYEAKCKNDSKSPVSINIYRRIFSTQYNYEFHKTKKDQCGTCHKYLTAKTENSADLALWQERYNLHISLKEKSQEAKELDKTRANTDETFNSVTMDLQKVLHIPNSNISLLYYLRKLNVYNATIYEARSPNEGFCFLWNEINGKKGSDEIGTALSLWIERLPPKVKEISIFTDTCGGQNRNQYLLCLLLYLVQTTNLDVIEHKYLESGHSHMEVDSIHSAIEHQLKAIPVFSMNDYCNIVKLARSDRKKKKGAEKKNPYQPVIMQYSDMLDLKDLRNNLIKNRNIGIEGEKIQWLKVKCFKFEKKRPGVVLYRYDFESEYKELDVTVKERQVNRTSQRKRKGREPEKPFDYNDYTLKKTYGSVLPITSAKKKDLIKMCTEKIIPTELHHWYENLPANDGTDYLPDEDTPDELQEQGETSAE